jgi:hypothetical protein
MASLRAIAASALPDTIFSPRPTSDKPGSLRRRRAELRVSRKVSRKKPVVGVIGSAHLVEGRFPAQRVPDRNLRAVAEVAGAMPLMFAGSPDITDIGVLLDTVDG